MYSIYKFSHILAEVELCRLRIEHLKFKKDNLLKSIKGPGYIKGLDYSAIPGSTEKADFVRVSEEINGINFELQNEKEILNELIGIYDKYETILNNLEGKEYKIAYMRIIDKKTYKEIAEELFLNENYVRQIGSKILK